MNNLGYVFVPIANALIEIAKVATFGFLAYHFNNIWVMLFYICCAGGGMSLTSSHNNKKEKKNNE